MALSRTTNVVSEPAFAEDAEERSYRCYRDRSLLLLDPEPVPMFMSDSSDKRRTTGRPSNGRLLSRSTRRHVTVILPANYSGTCTKISVRLLAKVHSNNSVGHSVTLLSVLL